MEQQLDDDFRLSEDNSITKKKRPAFLLVLCILTFIASGLGVIMGLINFTGLNDVESTFRNASAGADPVAQEMFDTIDIEGMQKIQDMVNILSLVASILCLGGALLMFKLRKVGFLPYVLGHGVAIYGSYLSVDLVKKMADAMPVEAMGDMMSMVGGATMIFSVIIAIAFIIMYGVNLKHLK
mgnify:CR=1 FL=1